jgi:hypothetical protein
MISVLEPTRLMEGEGPPEPKPFVWHPAVLGRAKLPLSRDHLCGSQSPVIV